LQPAAARPLLVMSVFASIIPNYAAAAILLSFGGLLNGYDTGSIGAIVHMAQFTTSMGALSPFARGMTVSAIMLTGVIPSFFAGQLADKYGRLRVIAPGALVFCVGAVFQAASNGLPQFIAGRAVAGFGQGVFLGNVTVYIAEIAPARRRGRLAALPQFMATLGICVGYFSCFGAAGIEGDLAWRLPYVVQIACSVLLAMGCRLLPESPRWLALSGRGDEAQEALRTLNFDMDEARRDFLTAAQDRPSLTDWQSFALLFRRGYRSQTWLALFMLSMVQLSGIDAITYVSHHRPRGPKFSNSHNGTPSTPRLSLARLASPPTRRLLSLRASRPSRCCSCPFRAFCLPTAGAVVPPPSPVASCSLASCFSWGACTPPAPCVPRAPPTGSSPFASSSSAWFSALHGASLAESTRARFCLATRVPLPISWAWPLATYVDFDSQLKAILH
jgi:MFS family permease